MALPLKSNQLIVVSGGAADPTISAGTADPSTGFSGPEGSIYLRYVASAGQLFVKTGPGDTDWGFTPIGASGCTLDQAYDFGGLGAGRTITADAGAIQIDANTIDAQAALVINRNPASAAGAIGINMTLGANVNTLGNGLQITDGGTGNSIYVQKNAAGVVLAANLTDPGAQALTVTVNGAPTSVSPVSIVANQTGTTASLLSVSKIPSGSTAGAAISVSMGANTTGPGITVSQAGSGGAIRVASGAIEMANSSPAVSAANEGRIKYNSTTQTFQASMNGSAYADLGGGGGGPSGPTPTSWQDIIDFVGDAAVAGTFFGASGTGQAHLTNGQTLTGPTGSPWPYMGVLTLHVQAAADDAFFDLENVAITSDGQLGQIATIKVETAFKCFDDQTTLGSSTHVQFYGSNLGFEASRLIFGNNHWFAMGDPAFPSGFDTGVAVETLRVHVFRVEQNPVAGTATWYIDGTAVHTATFAQGGALEIYFDLNCNNNGSNDCLIDYFWWSVTNPNRVP